MHVPVDRPIIYGLFVRHISLSWSVFLVAIAQAVMMVFLINRIWLEVVGSFKNSARSGFIICSLMALLSGLDFYISMIIPDIFTSAIVLSSFLLLFGSMNNKTTVFFTALIFAFSLIAHLSHLPMILGLFGLVGMFHLIKRHFKAYLKRYLLIFSLIVLSLFSLSLINYSLGFGFQLSRTKNVFLAARLINSGIANDYLKEACENTKQLPYGELCKYVDQFDNWPNTGLFLFDTSSPLYDGDCNYKRKWDNCWTDKDEAYGSLVRDILSDQKYFWRYAEIAITGTFEQLFNFGHTHLDKSELDRIIKRSFNDDWDFFYGAMQDRAGIAFNIQSLLEKWLVIISIIVIIYIMIFNRQILNRPSIQLITIVFLAILLNAFVCSAFSNVVDRYQGRLIFTIPLISFLLIALASRQSVEKSQD